MFYPCFVLVQQDVKVLTQLVGRAVPCLLPVDVFWQELAEYLCSPAALGAPGELVQAHLLILGDSAREFERCVQSWNQYCLVDVELVLPDHGRDSLMTSWMPAVAGSV